MPTVKGIAVAPGLTMGPVHVVRARPEVVPEWTIRRQDVEREVQRLHTALAAATEQYEVQQRIVAEASGDREAGIFAVHKMILKDPGALSTVEKCIAEDRINAESAVQRLIQNLFDRMAGLDGASVRRYAEDASEPWRVVLNLLLQHEHDQIASTEERVILAAAELTPQVVTFLKQDRILGVVTESGGRFSHGAVLVRSFGIPCVVGVSNLLSRLEQGMRILLDGNSGLVQLSPDDESVDEFLVRRLRLDERKEALEFNAEQPAVTLDGHCIDVGVNIGSLRDLNTFDVRYCDGVGLLRTEFLYMERSEFPSEEEQFRMYRRVVEQMEDRPVIFRTLDIGGDKQLPYFKTPKEDNPALGWRGLRITLEWQDLLRVQLRAILRASTAGTARIMLPMVTSYEEVLAVHEIFDGVLGQLLEQGYEVDPEVKMGIMIEVPSSIFVLPEIVQKVDFVSVGTNDLIQYLLAVDRDNPFVSKIYEPYHPAVMRALNQIARTCEEAGRPCGVCGEIAGDYPVALMLMGMGYRYLSVSPNFLTEIRWAVRNFSMEEAKDLAQYALAARTSDEVRRLFNATRDVVHARSQRMRAEAETPPTAPEAG